MKDFFFFFLNCYMLQIISTLRVWTKWFSSSLDDQDHELKVYSELEQCIDSLQWKCVGGVIGIFHSGALKSLCEKLFFFLLFLFFLETVWTGISCLKLTIKHVQTYTKVLSLLYLRKAIKIILLYFSCTSWWKSSKVKWMLRHKKNK